LKYKIPPCAELKIYP